VDGEGKLTQSSVLAKPHSALRNGEGISVTGRPIAGRIDPHPFRFRRASLDARKRISNSYDTRHREKETARNPGAAAVWIGPLIVDDDGNLR